MVMLKAKEINKTIWVSLIMICCSAAMVSAQESFFIDFTNNTGYEVMELYISPSVSDDWQNNFLENRSVQNEETLRLEVYPEGDHPLIYDVLAVDLDGDRYTRFDIDFSVNEERELVLTFDDFSDDTGSAGGSSENGDLYNQGYIEGYREGYGDAYSEGYRAGIEHAESLQEDQ
jgi:hypothetical protein